MTRSPQIVAGPQHFVTHSLIVANRGRVLPRKGDGTIGAPQPGELLSIGARHLSLQVLLLFPTGWRTLTLGSTTTASLAFQPLRKISTSAGKLSSPGLAALQSK